MKFFSFLIAMVLLTSSMFGQIPANNKIMHYTQKEGLSFGVVNSITQDSKGFMWFATSDGLNRFDGINFKVFKFDPDSKHNLPGNHVQTVFKDSKGTLWISSRGGLVRFDPVKERFIPTEAICHSSSLGNDVSHISEGRKGNLWVSTMGSGFMNYDKQCGMVTYNTRNLGGLLSNSVLNVMEDSKGLLWVGTQESGINIFSVTNKGLRRSGISTEKLPLNRINSVYEDHIQNVWIASSNGLMLFNRKGNRFYQLNAKRYHLRSNYFLSVTENNKKELLVGLQDGGLYKLDLSKFKDSDPGDFVFESVNDEQGYNITPRSVQTIYLDKDKNTWLGTWGGGVYMISSSEMKFKRFQKKTDGGLGESYTRYYGMCLDDDGHLWLGTDGEGIYKSTLSGQVLKHYVADGQKGSLSSNAILYGFKDSQGGLWFGTYSEGLFLYKKSTDSFINYRHNSNDNNSLGANDVRVVYEDKNKNIWVGTNGGGLNVIDRVTNKITTYNQSNSGIASNDIRSILEDEKGNFWIGTYGGGLNYFEKNTRRFSKLFSKPDEKNILSNNVVFSLYLDTKHRLWIGTEGDGLIAYNLKSKQIKRYTEKVGLADNTINAIRAENSEKLWVSTNKGLSKVDLSENKVYNFDESSGLQSGRFNEGSAIASPSGDFMCFGGTEGWNLFKPKSVKLSNYKPKVVITGLQLFGKQVEVGDEADGNILTKDILETEKIVLNPSQSVFSIQYTDLNYSYPKEGEFAYKLDGLDKDWNYVKNQHSATYRYLAPGNYVFKVKATNQDRVWSNEYTSFKITVLPPWYLTWWAYLFYATLTASVISFYVRYKAQQEKLKYEIKLAHLESEKEKELHEKKLSFFTNISHEFRTPLTLIINPVKELLYSDGKNQDLSSLNIVYRNARRLLSLVDQLLLFRKAESDADKLKIVRLNLVNLCNEVFLCFTHQARMKKIQFDFLSNADSIEIYGDREKIEIALFNLISNALKFTPENGSVSISLKETVGESIIEVNDSGAGIPENIGDKLFDKFYQVQQNASSSKGGFGIGLYLVKSFIESHKGSISYESSPHQGTSFKIVLPKGKEHLNTHLIFEDVAESSMFLDELIEDNVQDAEEESVNSVPESLEEMYTDTKSILLIDDNAQIRQYIKQLFKQDYKILESDNGEDGLKMVKQYMPDVVISDVMMHGLNGVELCGAIKEDPVLNHIPVILLTASASAEIKLKGIECGADDYISKPFEKELLIARVAGILKSRSNLQKYFFNEVTLNSDDSKISAEYKEFLDRCIKIVESHLTAPDFSIKTLCDELGMSKSNLYLKIKSISGLSANSFIRFIRLRKAAEIFVTTDSTIFETAYMVGIKDPKYFREQFSKLFNMNPSEYIKKYRKKFHNNYSVNKDAIPGRTKKD